MGFVSITGIGDFGSTGFNDDVLFGESSITVGDTVDGVVCIMVVGRFSAFFTSVGFLTSDVCCSLFFFSCKLLSSVLWSSPVVHTNVSLVVALVVSFSVILPAGRGGSIIVRFGGNTLGPFLFALPSEQAKLEQPVGEISTLK